MTHNPTPSNESYPPKFLNFKHLSIILISFTFVLSFIFYFMGLPFFNFFYFIIGLIFLFLIPGYQFIRLFKLKISPIEKITLSTVFGILLTTTLYYILRFNGLRYSLLIIIIFVDILFFFSLRKKQLKNLLGLKIKIDKINILFISLLIFNLLSISITSFPSGLIYGDELRFYEQHAHDSTFRLAVLGELSHSIPPTISYFSGVPERNYYFFGSLFINIINDFTKIPLIDLHFRFVPLFLFGMLTIITYLLAYHLFNNRKIALLSTFFIFFVESISFVFSLFATIFINKGYLFHLWNGMFDGSVIYMLHFSYPFLFSISLFFSGLLTIIYLNKYKRKGLLLLPIIIFGLMVQYRAFLSMVIFPSLFIIGVISYYYKKDKNPFIILFFSFIISIAALYKIYNPSGTRLKLFFAYQALETLEHLHISTVSQTMSFLSSHNIFLSGIIYFGLLLVFIIGIFGVRLITFPFVFKNILKFKESNPIILFLILCAIGSLFYPLFLVTDSIDKGMLYGFLSHSLIIFSFFLGPTVYNFLNKKIRFKKIIILLFVFFGFCGSIHFLLFHSLTTQGYYPIDKNELDSLYYIRTNTPEDAVFIHNIFDISYIKDPTLLNRTKLINNYLAINAIGYRRTVVSTRYSPMSKFIPEEKIDERINDVKTFFFTNNQTKAKEILEKYGVDYVYSLKNQLPNKNIHGLLTPVYTNSEILIYKVGKI